MAGSPGFVIDSCHDRSMRCSCLGARSAQACLDGLRPVGATGAGAGYHVDVPDLIKLVESFAARQNLGLLLGRPFLTTTTDVLLCLFLPSSQSSWPWDTIIHHHHFVLTIPNVYTLFFSPLSRHFCAHARAVAAHTCGQQCDDVRLNVLHADRHARARLDQLPQLLRRRVAFIITCQALHMQRECMGCALQAHPPSK
eukprot:366278-Chlamydomonas_euryale.AAC.42